MTDTQEKWLPVKGWEGLYEVSNMGNVRSLDRLIFKRFKDGLRKNKLRGVILRPAKTGYGRGYRSVVLCRQSDGGSFKKMVLIHILVAKEFIPNLENKPEINHIHGIKHDNRASELEWCTEKENWDHAQHVLKVNTPPPRLPGEKHGNAKATNGIVSFIRSNRGAMTNREMAHIVGLSTGCVTKIANRETWSHLP